ncbi:hypothetical protein ACFVYG_00290 [Streptomyces sp. NPDC058256]|uniref:hypothetical protein n=1 Tax=Streptomyces sp. NPDC058256 TaxID=3346408 RepID=UPI0036E6BC8A
MISNLTPTSTEQVSHPETPAALLTGREYLRVSFVTSGVERSTNEQHDEDSEAVKAVNVVDLLQRIRVGHTIVSIENGLREARRRLPQRCSLQRSASRLTSGTERVPPWACLTRLKSRPHGCSGVDEDLALARCSVIE